MRIVFLAGQFLVAGRHRSWAGLLPSPRHVELAASLHALGHQPVLLADASADRTDEIIALVRRQLPDAVVAATATLPGPVCEALADLDLLVVWTAGDRSAVEQVAPRGPFVHESDLPGLLGALGLTAVAPLEPSALAAVLPPTLCPAVGIELAHVDSCGVARSNDLVRVARAADDAARVSEDPTLIALVGLELLDAEAATRALAVLPPVAAPLAARARLAQLVSPTGEASALCDAIAVRLDAVEVELGAETPEEIGRLVGRLAERGAFVVVDAVLDDQLGRAELLADEVAVAGGEFSFTWAEGVSPETVEKGEQLLAQAGGATLLRQAALGPRRSLTTLFTGRSTPAPMGRGVEAVLFAPGAEIHRLAAVGLRTDLFGAAPTPAGPGRFWPLEVEVHAGVPRVGAGGEVRAGDVAIETAPYAEARHATPFAPLLLEFAERADVEAFLADADTARREGRFPKALVSPFGVLADSCAWGESGACAGEHLGRLVVEAGGEVRLAPRGPVVGHAEQSHRELLRSARGHLAELRAKRGCLTCPVADSCSKDGCLSGLIDDAAYCSARVARPWLVSYLDAIDAVRALRRDPAETLPRVSGFGGLLFPELDGRAPVDLPPVVLAERDGARYGFVPATGRLVMLTEHACLVTEALLTRGLESPVEAISRHLAIGLSEAAGAAEIVCALLAERGADIAVPAGRSVHPAGTARHATREPARP